MRRILAFGCARRIGLGGNGRWSRHNSQARAFCKTNWIVATEISDAQMAHNGRMKKIQVVSKPMRMPGNRDFENKERSLITAARTAYRLADQKGVTRGETLHR